MRRGRPELSLCAAMLGFVLVARPHATVIVGVQLPHQIVLAADSSVIDENGALLDRRVCKLVASDDVVFGLAGTTIGASFNAFHLAAAAARRAQTIAQANERFLPSVEPALRAQVQASIRNPEPVWRTIASRCPNDEQMLCGNLLHYVVAGDQSDGPRVSVFALNFRAPLDPHLAVDDVVLTVEREGPEPPMSIDGSEMNVPFALGTFDAISKDVVPDLLPVRDEQDAMRTLERLISRQMKVTPTRTSGPIDVIQLKPGRPPAWLRQKPECRDALGTPR